MTKIKNVSYYQAKNGGIYLSIGNISLHLEKDVAEKLGVYDIEDFSLESYKNHYKETKRNVKEKLEKMSKQELINILIDFDKALFKKYNLFKKGE